MEEESISEDKALWGIKYREMQQAIANDDESEVDVEAPAEGNVTDPSLPKLFDEVQRKVEETLDQMKDSLRAEQGDVGLYLRLNDCLLALQHWSDDIVVQKESPLATVEQDTFGFQVLAARIRGCFNQMIGILTRLQIQEQAKSASSEISTDTFDPPVDFDQPISDFEQVVNHLKIFLSPLRTFLEAEKNVGKVAVVRNAVETYLAKSAPQKNPRTPIAEASGELLGPAARPGIIDIMIEYGTFIKDRINEFNNAKDIWSDLKTFGVQLAEGNLKKMLLVAKTFYSKADADPKMKDDMKLDIWRLKATIEQTLDFLDRVKPKNRFGNAKFAMADEAEARRLNTTLKEQQRDLMMKIDVLDQYERHVPPKLLLEAKRFTRHHGSGYKINSFLSVATGDYTEDLIGGPPYVEKTVLIETADVEVEGVEDTVKEIAGLLHRKLTERDASQSNAFAKKGILPILGYRLKPVPELIFEMPAGFDLPANIDTRPKSLREVIIADKGTTNHPLDFRFRLARKLCEAALRLHVVQLVHKNIRPETIFLFKPAISGTGDDAEAAREAAGFGDVYLTNWRLLREASGRSKKHPGPNDWAERFYRHPERQGLQVEHHYNLGHDAYSLGVCLLEIGLWDSFVLKTPAANPGGAEILSPSARFVAAACEVAHGHGETGAPVTIPTPTPGPDLGTVRPPPTTPPNAPAIPDPEQERLLAQRAMLQPDNIKKVLLRLAREQLPARMGLGYKKLVVACLTALDTPSGFGPDVNFATGSRQDQVLDFVTLVQSYFQDLSKLKD